MRFLLVILLSLCLVFTACAGMRSATSTLDPVTEDSARRSKLPTAHLTASSTTINQGQSTTLTWSTANAVSVSIDQSIGSVSGSGSRAVTPTATTTYTLTARNSSGTTTASIKVTVGTATNPAPTVQFSASPSSIVQGQTATLSWTSTNAAAATINQGIGSVAVSGSKTITPTASTTYTITVTGTNGTATANATVAVSAPPPPSGSTAFDIKCSDPNVVKCFNFDTAITGSTNTLGIDPAGDGSIKASLDTNTYSSGTGSLRFDVPANANANTSGSFHADFSSDLSAQFGENGPSGNEFYAQWRQRFDPAMLTLNARGGGGWKLAIFGEGDTATTPAYSCTNNDLVIQSYYHKGFPIVYHSCGAKDGLYQGLYPSNAGDYLLQDGVGCLYSTNANCFKFVGNEWLTFQLHVKFGKDYRNDRNYHHDSTVELWVARDGQPSKLVISLTDYDLYQHDTSAINTGKLWFLPYESGRCPATYNISQAVRSGGTTTITTNSHYSQSGECLAAGDQLTVAGVADNSFNGTMTVVSAPSDTTVVVSQSGLPNATSSGGQITDNALVNPATAVWYDDLIISKRRLPDVGTDVPNAPDTLKVTNDGSANTLTWRDNSDIKGSFATNSFAIERCAGSMYTCLRTQSFTQVGTAGLEATWKDAPGSASTLYTYRVKAVNGTGSSAYTNAAANVPGAVSDVTATATSSTSVLVSWSQQSPASVSYIIERATGTYTSATQSSYTSVGTSSTRSFTDTSASANTTYVYRVKGINAAGSYTSWGEAYYGETPYGGMTASSQVTTSAQSTPPPPSGGSGGISNYAYGWSSISGARLKQSPSICPTDASLQMAEGCSGVIRDWTSAVLRTSTDQFIMTGGGHNGYSGNEQYAVNLKSTPATFTRITEPSLPGVGACQGGFDSTGAAIAGETSANLPIALPVQLVNVNGATYCKACQTDSRGYGCAPSAKHNYGQLVYIPANSTGCSGELSGDMLFEFNGYDAWSAGTGRYNAWVYHYDTGKWQRLDTWASYPSGVQPGNSPWGSSLDFDPVTKKVVLFTQVSPADVGAIGQWDLCTNTYTEKARSSSWWMGLYQNGTIDPANRTMVVTQGNDIYHINVDSFTMTQMTATATSNGCGPALVPFGGMAYDPDRGKIVMWPNSGSTVYDYDVKTASCSATTYGGSVTPTVPSPYNGTFGRFRYVPDKKIYVLVTGEAIDTMVLCRQSSGCNF